MAIYNLANYSGYQVASNTRTQAAIRYERHFNALAVPGLVVGDTVYIDVDVPESVRTIIASKTSSANNGDTFSVNVQEDALNAYAQPPLPLKTSSTVQTGGSTTSAASSMVQMQLYPIGNKLRMKIVLATSIPTVLLLSMCMYDY